MHEILSQGWSNLWKRIPWENHPPKEAPSPAPRGKVAPPSGVGWGAILYYTRQLPGSDIRSFRPFYLVGHIVRTTHIKRLALIVLWQTVMVAAALYSDSSPRRWIPAAFAVAALLVPFVAYIYAVYDAPFFVKWSRILRASVLTLLSASFTTIGYITLFFVELRIKGQI